MSTSKILWSTAQCMYQGRHPMDSRHLPAGVRHPQRLFVKWLLHLQLTTKLVLELVVFVLLRRRLFNKLVVCQRQHLTGTYHCTRTPISTPCTTKHRHTVTIFLAQETRCGTSYAALVSKSETPSTIVFLGVLLLHLYLLSDFQHSTELCPSNNDNASSSRRTISALFTTETHSTGTVMSLPDTGPFRSWTQLSTWHTRRLPGWKPFSHIGSTNLRQ